MRVACFLPSLSGGGAERVTVNLLQALRSHHAECGLPRLELDLVLAAAEGPFLDQLPPDVRLVDLRAGRIRRAVRPLARYLRNRRPDVLLSHLTHANLASVLARRWARVPLRLILVEHLTMSAYRGTVRRDRWLPLLARWLYPGADLVAAVSQAAASDLEQVLNWQPGRVRVLYNPVVGPDFERRVAELPDHPWLRHKQGPVVLAVGRLTPQKDFATLIEAFAQLPQSPDSGTVSRLIIVGEGEERQALEALTRRLRLGDRVSLCGFHGNPPALMRAADCLALSSRWEALPTVLIEALAAGCPVVATDCPSGPAEILQGGRYGTLVPPCDPAALARALQAQLDRPPPRTALHERGQFFSFQRAAAAYLEACRA